MAALLRVVLSEKGKKQGNLLGDYCSNLGKSQGSDKWLDCGYILKVESKGSPDKLDVGSEGKKMSQM